MALTNCTTQIMLLSVNYPHLIQRFIKEEDMERMRKVTVGVGGTRKEKQRERRIERERESEGI